MLGLLASVFVTRRFLGGDLGRGLPNLLRDVQEQDGRVAVHKVWSQVLTSILSMGTGGSAGLEAPIATTGAAVGSNAAQWWGVDKATRVVLLASGTAAGIAAIFNAPITGTVFALEILLSGGGMAYVVPVLIASATATFFSSQINYGQPFVLITSSWNAHALPFYLLLAVVAAFFSVYVIRAYRWLGAGLGRIGGPWTRAAAAGLLLGLFIFFFPPLYGEGYDSVVLLLHRSAGELALHAPVTLALGPWNIVLLAVGLMVLKVLAASATVHGGGNGGMFGPSLFTGAMLGFAFARTVNLLGLSALNEVNFTVVGMAAMLSGTIHAPLTAIFLIAEITGGYALFVPLMLVSALAFLICKAVQGHSVYGPPPVQR
jgi:CIC family chloride channel protein